MVLYSIQHKNEWNEIIFGTGIQALLYTRKQ